jgi:glucose-6-phosphate isomerase
MLYSQDISACFVDKIGADGLAHESHAARLKKADNVLADLRKAHETRTLQLLTIPEARADLAAMEPAAQAFLNNTTDICLFGTGGSSLGAQAVAQLLGYGVPGFAWPKGCPRLHFFDNLDPATLDEAFRNFDLRTTRFLVVSKSGGTPETMSQMLAALGALEAGGGGKYAKHHFLAVTEPKTSALRRFAEKLGAPIVDHPDGVGGRYSVLTTVGLLPARLMGLDPVKFREGAMSVLDPILKGAHAGAVSPALGAAVQVGLAEEHGMAVSVLMPYVDRLERFAMWYRQLWAESIGKSGKGTTPVRALGPVDQHSQVQLYLDGPRDKLFTLITTPTRGTGARLATGGDPDLGYLEGRTVGDLADAEARAMAETFIRNKRPTRLITVPRIDEAAMGALFMHFMLETIIAGRLMGVDPFDQPAVEQGKVLTRQYLKDMG